jgi:hypothetical protein
MNTIAPVGPQAGEQGAGLSILERWYEAKMLASAKPTRAASVALPPYAAYDAQDLLQQWVLNGREAPDPGVSGRAPEKTGWRRFLPFVR